MLKPTRSHQDFQNFIIEQLGIHYFQTNLHGTVLLFHQELAKVWITDLSRVYKILAPQYSGKKGAPPRDPVDMFRSLLLMELTYAKSIDEWVITLKTAPIWAIYSGFVPDDIPGVGTFYDFMDRLWLAESPHLSSKTRRPKRKPKKGKKKVKRLLYINRVSSNVWLTAFLNIHRLLTSVPTTCSSRFSSNVLSRLLPNKVYWVFLRT